jgi:CheY-like chemotaxis protein
LTILVSAYGRDEIGVSHEQRPPVAAFLAKPVLESTLRETMLTVLGQARNAGDDGHRQTMAGPPNFHGARVLLVEDNDINQMVARELLEGAGIQVEIAGNGRLGVDRALAGDFDVILMDVQMPVLDGYAATRELRGHARFADVPIIAMTANAMSDDHKNAMDAGMNDHISKPIDVDAMFAVLSRWLNPATTPIPPKVPPPETVVEQEGRAQPAAANLRGARVLLVEDNEINQMVARELLEGAGIQVEIADNGRNGVDLALVGDFDVVLMDVQMPIMDGYAASREIRSHPEFADLPIIAMTANAMSGDTQKARDAGMNDHISKPIDVDHMFAVLTRWLGPGADVQSL